MEGWISPQTVPGYRLRRSHLKLWNTPSRNTTAWTEINLEPHIWVEFLLNQIRFAVTPPLHPIQDIAAKLSFTSPSAIPVPDWKIVRPNPYPPWHPMNHAPRRRLAANKLLHASFPDKGIYLQAKGETQDFLSQMISPVMAETHICTSRWGGEWWS